MNQEELIPRGFNLPACRFGAPQRSGAMTVVPVFGPDHDGRFTKPLSGLKLSRVTGYGTVEMANPGPSGVAIVPLHLGYIQDQAQNHALCRSAFIAAGQKLTFRDAACVQAAQGGYLEGREQWFFILPVQLRAAALESRGQESFSKLWGEIGQLNRQYGLPERGHLEQLIGRRRHYLTQYQSRFELLEGQTGALFLVGDRLAGVEIAPSAGYFQEVWAPLVCFCYGAAAMYNERHVEHGGPRDALPPLEADSLPELRAELVRQRHELEERVHAQLAQTPREQFTVNEEERYLDLRLKTAVGRHFTGQFVEDGGRPVYVSLFARPEFLAAGT